MEATELEKEFRVSNYCACFIDLLGQRRALEGQNVMPIMETEQENQNFLKVLQQSVGAIDRLQVAAKSFRRGRSGIPSIRDQLSSEEKELYDEMRKVVAKQQRWSDGLVYYSSLETVSVKCPMSAVLEIFMLAGVLCFIGLSSKQPIRGAIEISWGVELHENELYGAVIANSYRLESEVAQYPRIVVGGHTMDYLNAYLDMPPDTENKLELYNRNCAQLCKNMTAVDQDGNHIVDYLGKTFTESVTNSSSKDLFGQAYEFICNQYDFFKKNKNTKLALRYTWLRGYFNQHKSLHS